MLPVDFNITDKLPPPRQQNRICSQPYHSISVQQSTHGNVTGTPIKIISTCGMLSQHTHMGPVTFQRPQLTPCFQDYHQ